MSLHLFVNRLATSRPAHQISIARQTSLKPHGKQCAVVIATASGINTVELRIFSETHQMSSASHGFIDVLHSQAFCILVANFSAEAMPLPENMMVACNRTFYVRSERLVHSSSSLLIETSKNVDSTAFSNVHFACCIAKKMSRTAKRNKRNK